MSKTYSIVGLSSMVVGTAFIGVGFYYTLKSAQSVGENDLAGTTDYSNLKKSINLFNSSTNTSGIKNLDLYVGLTGEGVGVGLRF